MRSFPRPTRTPIGIDLNGDAIIAAQMRRRRGSHRIEAAAFVNRQDPEAPLELEELHHLADVLERRGFHGQQVVLAMAPGHVLLDVVQASRREAEAGVLDEVREELARRHRWETDAFEMQCWRLPVQRPRDPNVKVMTAACLHEDSTPFLDAFAAAGFEIVALDTQQLAVARTCAAAGAAAPGLRGVLSIEWAAANLIVYAPDAVVYARVLEQAGLNRLEAALCARLDVEPGIARHLVTHLGVRRDGDGASPQSLRRQAVQAQMTAFVDGLITELRRSLTYVVHEFPDTSVTELAIVGSGARIAGMETMLANAIGVPAAIVSPVDRFDCRPAIRSFVDDPALCAAAGLALWS